jgi:hypothetical protein
VRRAAAAAAMLTALAACGQRTPAARDVQWSVERTPDRKGYQLTGTATYARGMGGWYQAEATLTDARGCQTLVSPANVYDVDKSVSGWAPEKFSAQVKLSQPVARASFSVTHNDVPAGSMDPQSITTDTLFSETRTLDARLIPPAEPRGRCGTEETASERRDRLRKKAETDPNGADAEAIAGMSRNEVFATAINSAGFLCARVTDAFPRGEDIIVSCVEYRSGSGHVRYRVNARAGTVEQL